jgi:hypothetical protein
MPISPAPRRQKQEHQDFKASLDYKQDPVCKNSNNKKQ